MREAHISSIKVVIVDDYALVRCGLEHFLATANDIQVVGTAADGETALRLCAQLQPTVVLVDLTLPGMDGIVTITAIRRTCPAIQVVALAESHHDEVLLRALEGGAVSYLLKNLTAEQLVQAARAAAVGRSVMAPEATHALFQCAVHELFGVQHLTPREQEVLVLLSQGCNNANIAQRLVVSRSTVKFHVSSILAKLGATSRTEAVAVAFQRHLIS